MTTAHAGVALLLALAAASAAAAPVPALPADGAFAALMRRLLVEKAPAKLTTLEPGKLKVCLYAGFPPAAILFPNGTWGGEEWDHLEPFAKANGLKLTAVQVPTFKDIWLAPGAGKCDMAAGGISITPERIKLISGKASFTDRYRADARALVVRAKAPDGALLKQKVGGPKDLAGKVVLVTEGSVAETDLQGRLKKAGVSATLRYASGQDKAAADLSAAVVLKGDRQPVFAYATGVEDALALATKSKGALASAWVHCLMLEDGTEVPEGLGYVVRTPTAGGKRDTSLLSALNAHVASTKGGPQGKWPTEWVKCSAPAATKP